MLDVKCAWKSWLVVIAGVVVLGCAPIGPFAGGRLSGTPGPADVSDWRFAKDEDVAQLETRPDDPHSVNTWFVALADRLYVPTSMIKGPKNPEERGWVQQVERDPNVRIRLGKEVFARRAVRVLAEPEYESARSALEDKYELDPAKRDPERTIWIFRLDPAPERR
jgi:hypothetical protein